MKVFENRSILCAARLHYAADVLLHYAARCKKNDKSGSASCAARLTSLAAIKILCAVLFDYSEIVSRNSKNACGN